MVSFRMFIVNVLLTLLFVVAVLSGWSMLALQNGGGDVLEESNLTDFKNALTNDINSYSLDVEEAGQSFQNSSLSLTSSIPFIDSIYNTWKVIKATPSTMYNLLSSVIFERLLGSNANAIILTVISIIITITIIFAVVKLISTGDSG